MSSSEAERINKVLESLLEDMPALSRGIVREIRSQVVEYDRVPLGDHAERVREQQELMIEALIERRGLNADDLERAADLGRLRATQGVSVEGVIGAFHVGNRELWRLIDSRADQGRSALPELAGHLWDAIHQTSTAIAAAHSIVARAQHTQDLRLRYRLIELIRGHGETHDGRDLAHRLGFDSTGSFVAARIDAGQRPEKVLHVLQEELSFRPGPGFVVQHEGEILLLLQGGDPAEAARLVRGLPGGPRAGIGAAREGLAGARVSMQDATDALAVTTSREPVVDFTESWWLACLVAQGDRLAPMLGLSQETAERQPHLAEAVSTFGATGLSGVAAARVLHVHPNSVAYRLDRWRRLTGADPRELGGLVRSLVAVALSSDSEGRS